MCGFLIGTVSLVLLARTLRRWAWGGHCGGGGCGGGGDGGHGRHGRHGWKRRGWRQGGWGMGGMLRWLFERLDTTPGQERVLEKELESLRVVMDGLRAEMNASRAQVANLMRQETLEGAALEEAVGKQAAALQKAHQALRDTFMSVHGALDARQRSALADMMEGHFGRHARHGRGRDWEI
jgi:hypothetical protein